MLVRSEIAGQKQILWIFGYTEGKNRLILSLGLGGIIQERGVGLKYPLCWSDFLNGAGCALQSSLHTGGSQLRPDKNGSVCTSFGRH